MNYNASQIGVPYARAYRIVINYPDNGASPSVNVEQGLAVKLADSVVRKLESLPTLSFTLDMALDGNTAIPLVNPNDATLLGANTTLNNTMLAILAVVRSKQQLAG